MPAMLVIAFNGLSIKACYLILTSSRTVKKATISPEKAVIAIVVFFMPLMPLAKPSKLHW
ncbi:hypothetical protein D3C76_1858880 [compost metagenome]